MDSGIWYYHPPSDQWTTLRHAIYRREAYFLALENAAFGQCAAVCIMTANLRYLMSVAGPDIYRLAHLEAGIVTNRLALSSEALDLAWFESGQLYDDETRTFLGIHQSGWEVLCAVAIGSRVGGPQTSGATSGPPSANMDWRD